tara:strand:+ start:418 stop:531 length:114 start_codon:yes stop_codon:yes gene_type:complete
LQEQQERASKVGIYLQQGVNRLLGEEGGKRGSKELHN